MHIEVIIHLKWPQRGCWGPHTTSPRCLSVSPEVKWLLLISVLAGFEIKIFWCEATIQHFYIETVRIIFVTQTHLQQLHLNLKKKMIPIQI